MKNLNKYYIQQKENEFKKLEEKRLKLSREIIQEEGSLKSNQEAYEKLQFENTLLKDQYSSLKKLIISRGVIFDIENKGFALKEWDNLIIDRKGSKYFVTLKGGEEIYSFDKEVCTILKEMSSEGFNFSMVVIRVASKLIKVQLRFIEKEE